MPVRQIALGMRSNPNRNDTQGVLVNAYAEDVGQENESNWALYACDGMSSFATLADLENSTVRGMLNLDDTTLYVVTARRLQRVNTAGTVTDMGAFTTNGYAYLARNRNEPNAQIAIVTSDGAFRIIENNSVSTPSVDVDIPSSLFNSVCFLQGYFIITCSNGEWYITSIDEGTQIDELEFAQANANPDGLVRGITRGQDLLICGPRSIEFYQLTGATDFPFERTTTVNFGVAYGATAINLAATIDGQTQDTVIFAGNNSDGAYAGVMMMSGYGARKISTSDVDRCIRDEPTKSSIRAFTRIDNGHVMYCITGTSFTREYNCDTGLWHNRKSASLSIWRGVDACHFNGNAIIADASSSVLYKQEPGLVPGSASTVTVRHSNDNGRTWKSRSAQAIGGSGTRKPLYWPALGQSYEDGKVFEITLSNAVVEAGVGTDVQVITPPVHSFPSPLEFNGLYVNVPAGTSQTSSAKGFYSLAVDVRPVAT